MRDATRRSARAQLEAAVASRDATVQKILGAVVQAYFEAITAEGVLQNKSEDESVARQTVASAQRRVATGQAGQNDLLQGATALAKSTLDFNRAQAAYEKALAELTYLMGLPAASSVALPGSAAEDPGAAEEEDLKDWLKETQRHHPAIVAARAALDAAREQVAATRASGRPTLDLTSDYYQNGFPNQGLTNINSRVVTYGLSISVPVFDGWLTHYKVEAARALANAKEAELEDTEQSTLMGVISAHADAEGERIRCLAEWRAARLMLLASAGRLDRAAVQY